MNLKEIKIKVIIWEKKKKKAIRKELTQIESNIQFLYDNNPRGSISGEVGEELKQLDQRRNCNIEVEETLWRPKSRRVWLKEGDKNNKIFHRFARHCWEINTIWNLKDMFGRSLSTY